MNNKKIELNIMITSNNKLFNIEEMDLTKLSKTELFAKCEELEIKKYKSKNKSEMIELITSKNSSSKKNIEHDNIEEQINKNEKSNLLECLDKLFLIYSLKQLSEELNVATGTITRWIELNYIPKNYEFDILNLSNIPKISSLLH